jgi:hypothetical protein
VELRYQDLFSNSLTGTVPTGLGGLEQLGKLYLSFNIVIGTFPNKLRRVEQLSDLHLYFNFLTGTIPT